MDNPLLAQEAIYGKVGGPPMLFTPEASAFCTPSSQTAKRPRETVPNGIGTNGPSSDSGRSCNSSNNNTSNSKEKKKGRCIPVEELYAKLKHKRAMMIEGNVKLSPCQLPGDFNPDLVYRALAAYALLRTLSVPLRLSPFTPTVFLRALYLPYPNTKLMGSIHVQLLRVLFPNLQMGYTYKPGGGGVGVSKRRTVDNLRYPLRAGDNLIHLDALTWPLFYDDYCHLTADRLWAQWNDEQSHVDFRNMGRLQHSSATSGVDGDDGIDDNENEEDDEDDNDDDDGPRPAVVRQRMAQQKAATSSNPPLVRRGRGRPRKSTTMQGKQMDRTKTLVPPMTDEFAERSSIREKGDTNSDLEDYQDSSGENESDDDWGNPKHGRRKRRRVRATTPGTSYGNQISTKSGPLPTPGPSATPTPECTPGNQPIQPPPAATCPGWSRIVTIESPTPPNQRQLQVQQHQRLVQMQQQQQQQQAAMRAQMQGGTPSQAASFITVYVGAQDAAAKMPQQQQQQQQHLCASMARTLDAGLGGPSRKPLMGGQSKQRHVVDGQSEKPPRHDENLNGATGTTNNDEPMRIRGGGRGGVGNSFGHSRRSLPLHSRSRETGNGIVPAPNNNSMTAAISGEDNANLTMARTTMMHPTVGMQSNQQQQLLRSMYLLEHQRLLQQMRLTNGNLMGGPALASPLSSSGNQTSFSWGITGFHGRPPQHGRALPVTDSSGSIHNHQQRVAQDSHSWSQSKPPRGVQPLDAPDEVAECLSREEQPLDVPKEVAERLQDFVRGVKRKADAPNPGTVDESLADMTAELSDDGDDEVDSFGADLEASRWVHFKPLEALRSRIPYHRLSVEYKLNILEFLLDELLTVDAISSEMSQRQAATELSGASPYGVLPTELELENLENDDECRICRQEGDLLCCDGCLSSYHHRCLNMDPAKALPEGKWLCPECKVADPSNFGPLRGGKKSSVDWFVIDDITVPAAANEQPHPSDTDKITTTNMLSTDGFEASSKAATNNCSVDASDKEQPKTTAQAVAETNEWRDMEYLVVHGYVFCRKRSASASAANSCDSELSTPYTTLTKSQLDACLKEWGIRLADSWPLAQIPSTVRSSSSGFFPLVEHYLCQEAVDPESYVNKYQKAPIPSMMCAGAAIHLGKLMSRGYEQECHPLFTDRIGEIMINDLSLDADIGSCLKARTALFDPYMPIKCYLIRFENTVRKACLMHEYWESGAFSSRGEMWTLSVRKSRSIRNLARLLLRLVNNIHPRAFSDVWFHNPHGRTLESGPSTAERTYMSLPGDWSEEKEKRRRRWQSTPSDLILCLCQARDLTAFASEIRSDIFIAKSLGNVRSKRKTHRSINQLGATPADALKIVEADTCSNEMGSTSSTSGDHAVISGSIPRPTQRKSTNPADQQFVWSNNAMQIHSAAKQENGSSPGPPPQERGEKFMTVDVTTTNFLVASGTVDSVDRRRDPDIVVTRGASDGSNPRDLASDFLLGAEGATGPQTARLSRDVECESLPYSGAPLKTNPTPYCQQQYKSDSNELSPTTETTTSESQTCPSEDALTVSLSLCHEQHEQEEEESDDVNNNAYPIMANDIETTVTEACPGSPRENGEDMVSEDRLPGNIDESPEAASKDKAFDTDGSSAAPLKPKTRNKTSKSKKLEMSPSLNRRTRRSGRLSFATSSTTETSCETPEQTLQETPPTPEVLDGMQLQIDNAKRSHIRVLEKLLKGQYLGEGIWPIAGRRIFPTSGDIPVKEMKRLARNAGTVKAADLVYDTKHEVAQVCYGHIWRMHVDRCSGFEELLLMIRILESSLDRTMIHSCENSAKRGKSGIQKVIRCTVQNPSTGYLEHFIVNRKSMKGCWIPALQLDLSSLMMELSNRRHVQIKQRQERVRQKEKADKEKAELIKAQRVAEAAKMAEEARLRKTAEAEEARKRKASEAEEARKRKAAEAAEAKKRKAAEAVAMKAEKRRKKQEEKDRTANLLVIEKQKTQAEIARLSNQIHLALAKHGEAMVRILQKCLSSRFFTVIPEADVIAIRRNTLEKVKSLMIGLTRLNVPKMDDHHLMALIFSHEKIAAASMQKPEQVTTHVESSQENVQNNIAVSSKNDITQAKFASGTTSLQTGDVVQNQAKFIPSNDEPPAEKISFSAPRLSTTPNLQCSEHASAASKSRSQIPSMNGCETVHSGGFPGPSLSSSSTFHRVQQMNFQPKTSLRGETFHTQPGARGNSDEGGSVPSMRRMNVNPDEHWRKSLTLIRNSSSHISGDHALTSHRKAPPEKDIASATHDGIFGRSPIVVRSRPHESEAGQDHFALDQRRQNDRSQIGSCTDTKPRGTDLSNGGGTSTAFGMDFEPKPLPNFPTIHPGTAGGLPNGNNLSGFSSRQEHGNLSLHALQQEPSFHQQQQLQQHPLSLHHQEYHLGHDHGSLAVQPEIHPEVLIPFNPRHPHHHVSMSQFGRNPAFASQLSHHGSNLFTSPQHEGQEHKQSKQIYPQELQSYYVQEQEQMWQAQHHQPQKEQVFGHLSQEQQEQQPPMHEELNHNQAQRYLTQQQVSGAQPFVDQNVMHKQQHDYSQHPPQHPRYLSQGQDYLQLEYSTTPRSERFDAQVRAGHGSNQQLQDLQLRKEQLQRMQQQYGSPPLFPS